MISEHLKEFAPKKLLVFGSFTLLTISIGFSLITRTPISFDPPELVELLQAVLVGLLMATILFLGAKNFNRWRDLLDWIFSKYSGKYRLWWILLFMPALVSLGEETFFRGFLQPNLGLIPTTFIFSIFHFRTNPKAHLLIPLAFIFGLVAGLTYIKAGTLLIPIALHFLVLFSTGFFYLRFIARS